MNAIGNGVGIGIGSTLVAAASRDSLNDILTQRTETPKGSWFEGVTADELFDAVKAADWKPVDEPGIVSPAQAFVANLPYKGTLGLVRFGDLNPKAKDQVVWLDPKETEGTPLGGALPHISYSVLEAGETVKTNRVILLVGPESFEPDAALCIWTLFPQPEGFVTPPPQPGVLEEDTWIKVIG